MKPHYTLSPEDWKFFEEHGFLGIPCWGGFVLRNPGYKNILVDDCSPEVRHIEDAEMYDRVEMLRGGLAP